MALNVKDFKKKIKQLKPLPDNALRFSWLRRRQDLRNKILNDNPEKFLTWPVIKETMFIGNGASQIEPELKWMFRNYDRLSQVNVWMIWERALQESNFGKPEMFIHNLCGKTSGNLINQAYYLKRWEDNSKYYVNQLNSIVEFGGGYGAMVKVCRQLGFTGAYTIVDLPEYLLLQEYYLSNVLDDIDNIRFVNTFDDYEIDADLMIAICSLSEVDETSKNRFFEQVEFKHHLIVFQPDWDDWDNTSYFSGKVKGEPSSNPYFSNHKYLVG